MINFYDCLSEYFNDMGIRLTTSTINSKIKNCNADIVISKSGLCLLYCSIWVGVDTLEIRFLAPQKADREYKGIFKKAFNIGDPDLFDSLDEILIKQASVVWKLANLLRDRGGFSALDM